jgi:sporadic carbohydrate cluster 2OG-Fe(II) oxygenase
MTFLTEDEARLSSEFAKTGYIIASAEDRDALDRIRDQVVQTAATFLEAPAPRDATAFLDGIGSKLDSARLNGLRLAVIGALTAAPWFREAYFRTARRLLETIVGNELAMQRGMGFAIQLPDDESSVLPLHSDVWSEDSPFEVVLWIPLVDCFRTKSMFVLPLEADARWRDRLHEFAGASVESFTKAAEGDLRFLDVPYGHVLVFTHTMMHGNRVNREPTARWSFNIRFKGLFTPYSDKQLGDFFEPITLRPATRIGMNYRLPAGFNGKP